MYLVCQVNQGKVVKRDQERGKKRADCGEKGLPIVNFPPTD